MGALSVHVNHGACFLCYVHLTFLPYNRLSTTLMKVAKVRPSSHLFASRQALSLDQRQLIVQLSPVLLVPLCLLALPIFPFCSMPCSKFINL